MLKGLNRLKVGDDDQWIHWDVGRLDLRRTGHETVDDGRERGVRMVGLHKDLKSHNCNNKITNGVP